MRSKKEAQYFNEEIFQEVSYSFSVYSYLCQYIEGVLNEVIYLAGLLVFIQLRKNPIKHLNFNIKEQPFSEYKYNLELFQMYFDKDELYKKLKKHGGLRNKYLHRFFEIINRNGLIRGKNDTLLKALKNDLEASILFANECIVGLDRRNKKLRKNPLIPKGLKNMPAPYKDFCDVNNKKLFSGNIREIKELLKKI